MGIRLVPVTIAGISAFAESLQAKPAASVVPVTPYEATVRRNNPVASPGDLATIVAEDDEGRCVGFVGNLPIAVSLGAEVFGVSWLSGAQVEEGLRGKGIAPVILKKYGEMQRTFITGGSSASALKALARAGCRTVALQRPVHVRLWPLRLLPRALRGMVAALCERASQVPYRINAIDRPSDQVLELLAGGAAQGFRRSPATIRWMLEAPWFPVAQPGATKTLTFQCYEVVDRKHGAPAAAFILSSRQEHGIRRTKLLDVGVASADAASSVALLVFAESLRRGVRSVTMDGRHLKKSWLGRIFLRLNPSKTEVYSYMTDDPRIERFMKDLKESHTTDGDLPFW